MKIKIIINRYLFFIFLLSCNTIYAQDIRGHLINTDSKKPIEFVNVGIVGENIGTVTGFEGEFNLSVDSIFNNDSILVSMIGYESRLIKVADLRKSIDSIILLKKRTYKLVEIKIKPRRLKRKTLGVVPKSKIISAGFKNNKLGYECGILIKVKKIAFIKSVNISIASCSYDSISYRLNIYKVNGKMDFENILPEPIYIKIVKDSIKNEISIDLQSKNILVEGKFLITLENIKDLGEGKLYFYAKLKDKTYYKVTSQGKWETAPVGIGISVIADVEE